MPDQPFVTSIDIINLSHSLKDICEVNCKTPECFSYTLKMLLQYNLIKLNLIFSQQLDCQMPPLCCPPGCGSMDVDRKPGRSTSSGEEQQESKVIEDLGILDLETLSSPTRLGSERLGLEELALLDHADSQKQK